METAQVSKARKRTLTLDMVKKGYKSSIRSAIRGYWNGAMDFQQFFEAMQTAIRSAFTSAFTVAARSYSLRDDEWSDAERAALRMAISEEVNYIDGLATHVENNLRKDGGKLRDAIRNVDLWVNRLQSVHDRAKSMMGKDVKLKWIRNAQDSCASCLALDGKVYRASVWAKYNLYPQCDKLECIQDANGVPVCRCRFEQTVEPGSRGRPPLYNKMQVVVEFCQ